MALLEPRSRNRLFRAGREHALSLVFSPIPVHTTSSAVRVGLRIATRANALPFCLLIADTAWYTGNCPRKLCGFSERRTRNERRNAPLSNSTTVRELMIHCHCYGLTAHVILSAVPASGCGSRCAFQPISGPHSTSIKPRIAIPSSTGRLVAETDYCSFLIRVYGCVP